MFETSFFVYVCKSLKDKRLYVGSTNNLERRLEQHAKGEVTSTKHRQPFELIYYEVYKIETDARMREKYLKGGGRARKNLNLQLTETLRVVEKNIQML
ncbi:MAG: GIY-YIG nuclease family protein [Patescibacteria group bacterium]